MFSPNMHLVVYDLYILETVSYVQKTSSLTLHNYITRSSRYVEQLLKFFEKKTNFIGTQLLSKLLSNIKN